MSFKKKEIRKFFRNTCFKRDKYSCVMCGQKSSPEKIMDEMDCHHITDGSIMPHGGTVPANGITLCRNCHIKAEQFHSTGTAYPGYSPEDLYKKINSSYEKAVEASKKLSS